MSQHHTLSGEEIASLTSSKVLDYQQDLVKKLTSKYNAVGVQPLKVEDVGAANDIFRELLKSAEIEVRSLLAMNLSHNDSLPVELAQMVVKDVSQVATPMLEYSNVLNDQHLLEIIQQEESTTKLEAIARRSVVSEVVSDALVETRIESVVETVVKNDGAAISDDTFMKITERHSDSEQVMSTLLNRATVPVEVVQQVIKQVSDSMRKTLEEKYGNLDQFPALKNKFDQSIEVTSLKMLGFKSSDAGLMRLLSYLDGSNKLTPFSALCMPSLTLFEISLARLLNIPVKNLGILLQDKQAFKQIYKKAELPEFLFEAAEITLYTIREIEIEHLKNGLPKDSISSMELLPQLRVQVGNREISGIDYIYALLQQSIRKGGVGH